MDAAFRSGSFARYLTAAAEYVDLVRRMNPDRRLQAYPGSPFIAKWLSALKPATVVSRTIGRSG